MLKKKFFIILFLYIFSTPANSACFVDYKAKKNNPFQLHYGVMEVSSSQCTKSKAEKIVTKRIELGGWLLLGVITLFDEGGLERRRESAGKYFLLY